MSVNGAPFVNSLSKNKNIMEFDLSAQNFSYIDNKQVNSNERMKTKMASGQYLNGEKYYIKSNKDLDRMLSTAYIYNMYHVV